jgi:hypothetical protein
VVFELKPLIRYVSLSQGPRSNFSLGINFRTAENGISIDNSEQRRRFTQHQTKKCDLKFLEQTDGQIPKCLPILPLLSELPGTGAPCETAFKCAESRQNKSG